MKILLISQNNAWSRELYQSLVDTVNIEWLTSYTHEQLQSIKPDWIFFFHWSEIVTCEIYDTYKCVVVHTANLPMGRGGSPLQNQIHDGIVSTYVNLIEMCSILDGGKIYNSSPITLQGNLYDIWITIAKTAKNLIIECINSQLIPQPQIGTSKIYKRRKNNQIIFDSTKDLSYIYDQIRMLDAETYPNIFLEINGYVLEFSRAKLENKTIIADVKITKKEHFSTSGPS